ncbi:hypothetical protein [Microvirga antarctica]|uniref:hypothetical protein n=1 Tax=Microvirga antarctica TaxID=2819233 RepID=UPI001B309C43|nr:hypothetical protein [Microvirga antarctica]
MNVTFIVLKIVVAVATIVGIVNLVATTAIILALKALRLHTWRSVLIAGALAGAGLLSLFSARSSSVPQDLGGHALDVINGGIAGILCAALYWTIATGGRRDSTSP